MAGELTIKYLEESDYERWDHFVDDSRQGSIYSQSYFLEAICKAFDTQFRILAVFKNEELVGGIGLHFEPGRYGDMIQLQPLLYYNGPVIKDFESKYPSVTESRQVEVIEVLLGELEGGRYASAELSNTFALHDLRPFFRHGWQLFPRYTYIVPISDPAVHWERVEQNFRRLISRCERQGFHLEPSDAAGDFYSMHEKTYLRKGVQPYIGRDQFITLHQALKARGACQIYFAVTPDGRRAAGEVVLMSKHPLTHTWMAGSEPDMLRTGASAFLRWKVLEDLHQRGYTFNDLTDAMNEQVAKFKRQLGGTLENSFVVHKIIAPRLKLQKRILRLTDWISSPIRGRLSPRSTDSGAE